MRRARVHQLHGEKEQYMNIGKFLEGLVLGALTGAAVALFMAPQSGKDMQDTIRQRINMVIDEGKRASAERRAELESQFAQARQPERPIIL
jgi:gas vesicle protein